MGSIVNRRRYSSSGKKDERLLPYGYFELKWIESTGSQYIDTELVPDGNTEVKTKIEVTTTDQNTPVFGCNLSQSHWGHYFYHLTPYKNKWFYGGYNAEYSAGIYNNVVGTVYTIVFNSESKIAINNDVIVNDLVTGVVGNSHLFISGRHGNTGF